MMAAASRNTPVTPATRAGAGAAVTSRPTDSPLVAATIVENTAPASGTPDVWPSVRDRASSPEAIPRRCRGAAPITALLFGELNIPTPMPSGAMRTMKPSGPMPAVMAGHSLGEYSALVCAGALPFAQAVQLVRQRGEYMQQAVPLGTGAMAAVLGLERAAVEAACAAACTADEIVAVANYNAPLQSVVAGHTAAVARAGSAAQAAGAKRVVTLPVSAPFHCSLMRPAADALAPALAAAHITPPAIPVINNVDVAAASEPEAIRDALIRQIYSPVRWVEVIEAMAARGVTRVVECGPGKVLAGLTKRICSELDSLFVQDPASLRQALAALA